MTTGQLFIVSAPSGTGKSTLISKLLESELGKNFYMSISHTTRAPRTGETDGVNYHFVSKDTFKKLIAEDNFLEWAEVFGNFYGTSKKIIDEKLAAGINVILDIDWQGAINVRKFYPQAKSLFISPPSIEALRQRLIDRKTDSAEVIARRMSEAEETMSHKSEYDFEVVNDDLEHCFAEFVKILSSNY